MRKREEMREVHRGARTRQVAVAGALLLLAAVAMRALASTYTGPVLDVREQASPQTAGNVRVSIEISGTTACNDPTWYSFDLPAGPLESLWSATVLAALSDGANVNIGGTGTCDVYGIEVVSYLDALPPSP